MNCGGRPRKTGTPALPVSEPTLRDIGISKRQSSDWQKLAAIPEAEFLAILASPGRRTTNGIIREWHGATKRRIASLERMAAELRAAGWTVFPPPDDDKAGAP